MNRHFRLALHVVALVAAFFALAIWWHGDVWLVTDTREAQPPADFVAFYAAARLSIDDPSHMYSPARQAEMQSQVTGLSLSADDPYFLPFAYPAVTALALSPLALVSYQSAYWLMAALNLGALGIVLYLLSSHLHMEGTSSQVLALAVVSCVGVYATLVQGQLSIFVVLGLCLAVLNLRKGNDTRAGVWAGLLSFKPIVLPGLLAWMLIRKKWTALGTTCLMSGFFALGSLVWIGPAGFDDFRMISASMLDGSFLTAQTRQMYNLRGLAYSFGLGDAGWFAGIVALLLAIRFARVSKSWDDVLLLLAIPLLSVHMNPQGIVLLIPAIAFASTLIPMTRRNQRMVVLGSFVAGWASLVLTPAILPLVLIFLVSWLAFSGRFTGPSELAQPRRAIADRAPYGA